jgi:translocator protein
VVSTIELQPSRARRRVLAVVVVALLWVLLVAGLGGLVTDIGPWYFGLRQPAWKPPDAWFGPAWSLIFAATAWGASRAWLRADSAAQRRVLLLCLLVNSVLNVAWSWIFFSLRRPDLALMEWAALWLSIAALMWACGRIERVAGLLLLPYLLWVSFAGVLNLAVVRLNAPFAAAATAAPDAPDAPRAAPPSTFVTGVPRDATA